jgi:hypothetical protein
MKQPGCIPFKGTVVASVLIAAAAFAPAVALAQAGPGPQRLSLAVVADPGAPLQLLGNEDLAEGSHVATRRVGDNVIVPAASSLRVRGEMTVSGTQGGLILTNLAPSSDPHARRIYVRGVSDGAEWQIAYQGMGAERAASVLVLPGGNHGDFEFILDADGRNGAIVFADGALGVFDLGEDFYAASGQRGLATLLYGTLRTRVTVPRLELLAFNPDGVQAG